MKFVNRWKIIGTLTTITPLRVGDGDTIEASERLTSTYLKADTKINTVATDNKNKPYIPASAIKGNLRTWAENILSVDEIDIIFGSKDPKEPTAKAGKVQFSNAYLVDGIEYKDSDFSEFADWSLNRLTAVSVGIAVDRKTRTASDKKLFHQEYVPEGITFKFEISGNDYEDELLKDDDGLKKLLMLLDGFNHSTKPVCIGAETVGLDKSWGRLKWNLESVKKTKAESLKSWFESNDDQEITDTFEVVETKDWEIESVNPTSNQPLEMSLSLQLLDDFLVNDPSKVKTPDEVKQNDPNNKKPNHSPLRNKDGKPILPKSSIKGAIRSQAERILRTMTIGQNEHISDEELKRIACYPDDMKNACPPIKEKEKVEGLCLACQLFGASGWKSPMSFTDFTATEPFPNLKKEREFVAIDRFTGGVSGSGKFNAEVANRPLLEGSISFDQSRLDEDWAIGLLALTFKDLLEGDIRLGFGRAKGFGEIKNVNVENHNLIELFSDFKADLESLGMFESINLEELGNSDFGLHLQICIEQLIEKISKGVK